ncbi:sensor histidine kinase N-terminal domain-containing protein [Primorskyibacter sp. S187A]|uniref:sensor histidine kinase N-terminal domain-containing protein n=1 Tax=Primorskyibacter sp. S187A TaxID=3415130 RepID=UPI003C7D36AF
MIFPSLRSRLIAIILTPLLIIAAGVAIWQYSAETARAKDMFDRGLLSAALAISRDVAISDGDALSPNTRSLINNTSGGEVFYHVYAPDGVFVTGYSTPPVSSLVSAANLAEPVFYDARYQGEDVRVLRFQYITTVGDVSGVFNVTVWQDADLRQAFVNELVIRSITGIALLVASVGLIVWFGVGFGLRPLLDLESAIAKRSATELEPIRRQVPVEARGIVTTVNTLLDRVSRRISSKDEFISNAAHQLRNPVAGVLALAEAVENAPNPEAARTRSAELVKAAQQTSRLTNQLLSFERAAGSDFSASSEVLSLKALIHDVSDSFRPDAAKKGVVLSLSFTEQDPQIVGDRVMIQEALLNVLNNAIVHGGPSVDTVLIRLSQTTSDAVVQINDNGIGIPADQRQVAISRFGQAGAGPGSGLGLAIAQRVMSQHDGHLHLLDDPDGAAVQMVFPRVAA